MPALAPITVDDRQSTPVAHTFVPFGEDKNGVVSLIESNGVPIGDNKLTVSLSKGPSKQKVTVRLSLPVVVDETINGVASPKVVRTAYADLNLSFDSTSSSAERKDLIGLMSNLLAGNTSIDGVAVDLEKLY